MGVTDVMRVLARIAKTGKPGDRLRAAELIGRQLGMFREKEGEPGRSFADLVLAAQRRSPPALGSQVTEGDAEGG